jgi:hypothetical protein
MTEKLTFWHIFSQTFSWHIFRYYPGVVKTDGASLPARAGKIPDQVGNDGENGNDMRRSGMTTDKLKIDN